MARSVTAIATETIPAAQKDKGMIKITASFDSRKFMSDLEQQVQAAARQQVLSKLKDLERRGLRTSFGPSSPSSLNIQFDGPEELITEAKRRLT